MAWETRGNNSYYYRKKKVGGKVVSEYVGRGLLVQEIASMDSAERQRKNKEIAAMMQERSEFQLLDQRTTQATSFIKQIIEGVFLISGLHKHKGQWRKMRNGRR